MACNGISGRTREGHVHIGNLRVGGRGRAWVCVRAWVVIVFEEGVATGLSPSDIRHEKQEEKKHTSFEGGGHGVWVWGVQGCAMV